jgi:hypothetical protein
MALYVLALLLVFLDHLSFLCSNSCRTVLNPELGSAERLSKPRIGISGTAVMTAQSSLQIGLVLLVIFLLSMPVGIATAATTESPAVATTLPH